jgi:hypothetical protein
MPSLAIPPSPAAASGSVGHRATLWDRIAVLLLGAAGCVLSYDALRQMAFAIHVRPALTYLFPVVIDGFIAYGVRALLVLRAAPLRARLYVWTLFATATGASVWANALHAIRLNELPFTGTELRLGDATVGVLSMLAPLALAGATHLHILITRHGGSFSPTSGHPAESAQELVTTAGPVLAAVPAPAQEAPRTVPSNHVEVDQEPVVALHPDSLPEPTQPAARKSDVAGQGDSGTSGRLGHPGRTGRPPAASIEELVDVVAAAHPDLDELSRSSARAAINAQGLSVGADRLTEVLVQLRPDAEARPRTGLAADPD